MSVKYFPEQAESKITNSPNPEPKIAEFFNKLATLEARLVQNTTSAAKNHIFSKQLRKKMCLKCAAWPE